MSLSLSLCLFLSVCQSLSLCISLSLLSIYPKLAVNLNAVTQMKETAARDGNHFNERIDVFPLARFQPYI